MDKQKRSKLDKFLLVFPWVGLIFFYSLGLVMIGAFLMYKGVVTPEGLGFK